MNGSRHFRMQLLPTLVVLVSLLVFAALARGAEFGDISVTAQPPPRGLTWHGYIELRVDVVNHSPMRSREVRLEFPGRYGSGFGDHLARISRTVKVGPQASARVPMWVPALPSNGGELAVVIDGRRQQSMVPMSGIDHGRMFIHGSTMQNPTLLLSRRVPQSIRDAGELALIGTTSSGGSSSLSPPPGRTGKEAVLLTAETESPQWSSHWLAYTAYTGVMVTGEELRAMPAAVREAIWQYVIAGGGLIVIGKFDLPQSWAQSFRSGRTKSDSTEHTLFHIGAGLCYQTQGTKLAGSEAEPSWREIRDQFASLEQPWARRWNTNDAVTQFPVVEKITIPARGLLGLVIFFALIIGPINALVLTKLQRRIWMLWTVPTLSLVMSLAVFGYGALSEGWSSKARSTFVTLLDQPGQTATTWGVTGFYAPLTPRDGLRLPSDVEVTPVLSGMFDQGSSRTMDWSVDQHLDSGWISARVPSYLMIRRSERRTERLTVSPQPDDSVTVVNGLGGRITKLSLVSLKGLEYTADQAIEPGASVTLRPQPASKVLRTVPPVARTHQLWQLRANTWPDAVNKIAQSTVENLHLGSYLAELDATPFVPDALANIREHRRTQVVLGLFDSPPTDLPAPASTTAPQSETEMQPRPSP